MYGKLSPNQWKERVFGNDVFLQKRMVKTQADVCQQVVLDQYIPIINQFLKTVLGYWVLPYHPGGRLNWNSLHRWLTTCIKAYCTRMRSVNSRPVRCLITRWYQHSLQEIWKESSMLYIPKLELALSAVGRMTFECERPQDIRWIFQYSADMQRRILLDRSDIHSVAFCFDSSHNLNVKNLPVSRTSLWIKRNSARQHLPSVPNFVGDIKLAPQHGHWSTLKGLYVLGNSKLWRE